MRQRAAFLSAHSIARKRKLEVQLNLRHIALSLFVDMQLCVLCDKPAFQELTDNAHWIQWIQWIQWVSGLTRLVGMGKGQQGGQTVPAAGASAKVVAQPSLGLRAARCLDGSPEKATGVPECYVVRSTSVLECLMTATGFCVGSAANIP